MKKKLYYTVDIEFHDGDYNLGSTGHKTINIYDVVNGEVKLFFEIDRQVSDNSETEIQEYLNDNGYSDEPITLVLL